MKLDTEDSTSRNGGRTLQIGAMQHRLHRGETRIKLIIPFQHSGFGARRFGVIFPE